MNKDFLNAPNDFFMQRLLLTKLFLNTSITQLMKLFWHHQYNYSI